MKKEKKTITKEDWEVEKNRLAESWYGKHFGSLDQSKAISILEFLQKIYEKPKEN